MNTQNLTKFFKSTQMLITRYTPEILSGIGIAGMITTTFLAVKATPKALRLIEEEKNRINEELALAAKRNGDKNVQQINKLKNLDTIKVAWKPYLSAVITGITSTVCLIGSSSVNFRRNAALATAYQLSEAALTEYKEKVVETIGEKKEQLDRDNIAKDRLTKDPVSNHEVIITAKGDMLCYDAIFGRYFKSDIEKIKQVSNDMNYRLRTENYISVNEFFYELGVPNNKAGEDLGWNINDGQIEVYFNYQGADDGTPCLVLDYYVSPRCDFRNLY